MPKEFNHNSYFYKGKIINIHLFKVLAPKENCVYQAESNALFLHLLHEVSGRAYPVL